MRLAGRFHAADVLNEDFLCKVPEGYLDTMVAGYRSGRFDTAQVLGKLTQRWQRIGVHTGMVGSAVREGNNASRRLASMFCANLAADFFAKTNSASDASNFFRSARL